MKQSIPHASPSISRAFTACLLSLTMLLAPLASFAAPSSSNRVASTATSQSSGAQQRSNVSADQKLANELFVNPPAMIVGSPAITASMTDSFPDLDGDGKANPGETVTYTANISNVTGSADATGVTFTDTIDPNTTLVANSLKISPLAFADSYNVKQNTQLVVGVAGVLSNDTGLPAPAVGGVVACADVTAPFDCSTTAGGTVTVNSDGSFTYNPPSGFTGADTFVYTATNGQLPKDTATVTVTVTSNQAPVLANIEPGTLIYTNGGSGIVITNTLTVSDADDTNIESATISITNNFVTGEDLLEFVNQNGITGNYVAATGILTLTGTSPVANYQTALRSVTYRNSAGTVTASVRTVSFVVNDGDANSNAQTRNINVVNNTPPTITDTKPAAVTMSEDGSPTAFSLTLNATDVDGDTLTWSISSAASNGTATASGTGTSKAIGYTPNANYNGSDSFTVQVSDGNGGTDTIIVNVTINAVNDAPTITDTKPAAVTMSEDGSPTAFSLTLNATDVEGDTITWSISSAASNGTATASGTGTSKVIGYTPNANYNGSDSFTVQISDGNGGTDTIVVNVTINAVNDAPSFTKGADQTVNEDVGAQTVAGWATALSAGPANESGQTLTFVVTNNTNSGLFSAGPTVAANGTLTYTPAANANGSATITLKITDNGGTTGGGVDQSATQSFVINVTPVNDVPSFTKGVDQNVNEDAGPQTVAGWATLISAGPADESAQTLTFAVTANTNAGLFSAGPSVAANGDLTYTPTTNANGTATITLRISDNGGIANGGVDTSATQTFVIMVGAVNDPPSFTKGADQTVNEDAVPQSVSGWATAISAGPADEAAQTLTFVIVSNTNSGLFSAGPAVASNGTLTYTLNANANGTAAITLKLTDSGGGTNESPTQTFNINVTAVNDAPALVTSGGSASFTEDGAAVAVDTGITVTDIDSATLTSATIQITGNLQTAEDVLAFTNDGSTMGNIAVSVAYNPATGLLTLSSAGSTATLAEWQSALRAVTYNNTSQNPNTTARTVSFRVTDPGALNSNIATKGVTVTAVNDAPVLTASGGFTYTENDAATAIAPAITVADVDSTTLTLATITISANFQSGEDVLSFTNVAMGNIAITSNTGGVLTLSSAGGTATLAQWQAALQAVKYNNTSDDPNTSTRTVSFQVNDGAAVNNLSNTVTRTIAITAVNDPPTANGFAGLAAQAGIPIAYPIGKLGGTDVEAGTTITIDLTPINVTNGTVTLNANGSFVFTPLPNATTGSFQYRVSDNGNPLPSQNSAYVTVSFTVAGPAIYFVKQPAVGLQNCTLLNECPLATAVANIAGATNTRIFIEDASTYATVVPLNSNGWLIGQGLTGTTFGPLFGIVAPVGGGTLATLPSLGQPSPTISVSSAGNEVTLNNAGTTNSVRGLNLTTGSGTTKGISGTGFGTLTVTDMTISGSGPVVDLSTGTVAVTLASASSNGSSTEGIRLDNLAGTFTANAGSLQTATNADVSISGNNSADTLDFTFAGTITDDLGTLVSVANQNGGTKTFSGAITDGNDGDGSGITLTNNTGAIINFTNTLTLSTGGNPAFTATGGGTVSASNTTSTITTTTATALNVANTTIGASNLKFLSITSNTASANSGIVLNNTGASGGLVVIGAGGSCTSSANCTGGSISNKTVDGVSLTSTFGTSLSNMNVSSNGNTGAGASGIIGTTVTNLTITACNLLTNGVQAGQHGINLTTVLGTSAITNTLISQSGVDNLHIDNTSGTLTLLTISGNTFKDSRIPVQGNDGFQFFAHNGAIATILMTGNTFTNNLLGAQFQALDTSNVTLTIQTNTFTNSNTGLQVLNNSSAHLIAHVGGTTNALGNTFTAAGVPLGSASDAFTASNFALANSSSDFNLKFEHNNVTIPSGGVNHGVVVFGSGTSAPLKALLDGNTITNNGTFDGIHVNTPDTGSTPIMNVTVTNNTVNSNDLGTATPTISINCNYRRAGTGTFKIETNTTTSANGGNGIQLRRTLGTVQIERGGSASNTPSVVLAANNPAAAGTGGAINVVTDGTITVVNNGTILPPSLLFAPGGVEAAFDFSPLSAIVPRFATSSSLYDASNAHPIMRAPIVVTTSLNQQQLDSIVAAAIAGWSATGLTPQQLATLRNISFDVGDLAEAHLGEVDGNRVLIDRSAGGKGWYLGADQASDLLFSRAVSITRRSSDPMSAPAGHLDLLTAIEHEMGHKLGLNDSYAEKDRDNLMYGYLTVGERRLPAQGQAQFAKSGKVTGAHFLTLSHDSAVVTPRSSGKPLAPLVPFSGETVGPVNIGTIPMGKSVTITFQVTVNNPPGARQISTQGTVHSTTASFADVLTDDPAAGGANDPTVTQVNTIITWTGTTDTKWDLGSNWDTGVVPVPLNDVVIPLVATNHPNIRLAAGDVNINSLLVANGVTLTIDAGRTLTLSGTTGSDLTLNGIIAGGALQFGGAGPHVINNVNGTGNLSSTNTTTVASPSTVTLNHDLQMGALAVNSGAAMDITDRALSLNGPGAALTVAGTLTLTGSTIIFNGTTGAQTTDGLVFNNLTANNTAGVTLNGNTTVNGVLNLAGGDVNTGAFTLSQPPTPASIGTFDVVGAVRRFSDPLPTGTVLTFGNPNNQVTFAPGGTIPMDVTMVMAKSAPATYMSAVKRNYNISQTGGSGFTATLRLHYLDSELNGNNEANLNLRRLTGSWQAVTTTARDATENWVESNAVTAFSQWALAALAPTASSGSISGTITDANGNPVAGTVIRLSGTQTRKSITDAFGIYRFSNVEPNGFYTVTPSRVNYNFSPFNRSFSQLGNQTEAVFGATFNGDTANPLDTPEYFVRQQYVDVLGREPDEAGFNFWSDRILVCGNDADCIRSQRIAVAAEFFIHQEFQQSGAFIYNLYSGSLSRRPAYAEYALDRQQVVGGPDLEAEKQAFAESFVQRGEFMQKYQTNATAEGFVDALLTNLRQTSGVELSNQRDSLIARYNSGASQTASRSFVLRDVTENALTRDANYNQAFVLTEYFGYLRRGPDRGGYDFWLNVVNNGDPGNYNRMVCSFITSREYQERFSAVVSHGNAECGQ